MQICHGGDCGFQNITEKFPFIFLEIAGKGLGRFWEYAGALLRKSPSLAIQEFSWSTRFRGYSPVVDAEKHKCTTRTNETAMQRKPKQQPEKVWPTDGLATVRDACEFLNISRSTLQKWLTAGKFPVRQEARTVRIPWHALRAYVNGKPISETVPA